MEAHAELLRDVTGGDDTLVAALRDDWRTADLGDADRAMLAYADKLTREPAAVGRDDLDTLRAVGFDDQAILQIALITSFFNYVNRVADGIGVGRGD